MPVRLLLLLLAVAILICSSPGGLQAAVDQFIRVEGLVELLRQGKTPVAAKAQDGVEPWDLIRTW